MLPGKEKATILPVFKKDKDTPMLAPFSKGIFEVPLKKVVVHYYGYQVNCYKKRHITGVAANKITKMAYDTKVIL